VAERATLIGEEWPEPAAETVVDGAPSPAYGYWTSVWRQLRRRPLALAAAVFLAFTFLACFVGAPIAARLLGHGPLQYFAYGAEDGLKPVGPWSWVPDQSGVYPVPSARSERTLFLLGGDGSVGRDEFLRLLYGGRSALEVALGAALLALVIGVVVGAAAGFFGGVTDAVASRTSEFVSAFPLLLLVIAIGWTVGRRLNEVQLVIFPRGVLALIVVIGAFTWPYPARLVRAQVLALREREFVEAARMIGGGNWRIIRSHLLPYVLGTVLAYAPLIIATNVVLEAALSVLNLGLPSDTPDWGNMLSQNWGSLLVNTSTEGADPSRATVWTQAFPAGALLLTILAFSLIGETLREAADPASEGKR
jgi:peptide/nickel transport system permease protein